jgi:hypothetical protein
MRPYLSIFTTIIIGLIVHAGIYAQAPPWQFSLPPNEAYVSLSGKGKKEPSQAYSYVMVADSTCHVEYTFSESRLNGHLIALEHWSEGNNVHAPAPYLTFNSRTRVFPVAAGDTISFYRELEWYNPTTRFQGTTNYISLDTLQWIAHLVRNSDGAPIAMLDSTGILPNLTHGPPRIYGSRPLMAVVRYVVPSTVTGDSAFIGFTVRTNGSGQYHFVRYDLLTFNISKRLTQAFWIDYLNHYSPSAMAKRAMSDLVEQEAAGYTLTVTPEAGRSALISFNAPDGDAGGTTVSIYDAAGQLLFSPYATPGTTGSTGQVRYQFPQSGPYFIALVTGNRIARLQKITVN